MFSEKTCAWICENRHKIGSVIWSITLAYFVFSLNYFLGLDILVQPLVFFAIVFPVIIGHVIPLELSKGEIDISHEPLFSMTKTTFGNLNRGDQFMGEPHGGWIFVKTDLPNTAVRFADGGVVDDWQDSQLVFKTKDAT